MATDSTKPISPTAAVVRHLEWLEFALAAARDEEVRRQGRLDKSTSKNREKRSIRLAEVTAEVVELAALVTGLKGLQAGAAAPTRKPRRATGSSTPSRRAGGRPRGTASSVAAGSTAAPKITAAAAAAKPAAASRKPVAASRKPAAAKSLASGNATRTTTARKSAASGAKKPSTRTRKPRTATRKPAATPSPSAAPAATAPSGPTV